jgi:hypothetical protein
VRVRAALPLLLLFVLGLASPATAAADLARVTIEVNAARNNGALASLRARIEVEGERIVQATLTPPGGMPAAIPLGDEGFILERTFMSEQEFTTALPDGGYVLTLNGSTQVLFDYARAAVPSPAISAPPAAAILVPGPVTVEFAPCPACAGEEDLTRVALIDAETDEVIAEETLGPEDASWTPDDGGEPLELPEDGSFWAAVQHVALRTEQRVAPNSDAFELVTSETHGDAVQFFTGAAPPAGSFCLVVGDDAGALDPLGECLAPDVPEAALIDPSGAFALTAAGVEIEYAAEVSAGGAITGSASADLDGNGSLETTTPLRGKLQGFLGKVDRRVAFDFRSAAPAAKLALRIHEQASVTEGPIFGSQRAKGSVLGAKVKDETASTLPLGDGPLGWRLDVELDGKHVETASIRLEDGRSFALRGRFVFDFLTDLAKLDVRSPGEDEGVQVRIEDFRVDDFESQPPAVSSGDFTFKILGQRGRFPLQ